MMIGRILLVFALPAFLATGAMAQETATGGWIADPRNGCKLWRPAPKPGHTAQWAGPCKAGLMEGKGTVLILYYGAQAERYEGTLQAGRFEGIGAMNYSDGARYSGQWRDGLHNGMGTFWGEDGTNYIGEWRDGQRTGKGVVASKDGSNYQGDMLKGKPHGRGVLTTSEGARYEGDWSAGTKTGQGVQVWKDGARYEGGWKDNKASGSGVYVDAKGNRWSGTWLSGCLRTPNQRGPRMAVGIGATACPYY